MERVLVSDKLSEAGLQVLRDDAGIELDYAPGLSESELADRIGAFDALIVRSGSRVTADVIAKADRLRVIGRAGIGVDNVDVAAASRRGIVVMNTPTGNATTTAEHALALIMSLARNVPQAAASTAAGRWEKSRFQGRELSGKTLGIVGLGNIGRIVANRAQGLRMAVIGTDPVLSAAKAAELGIELVSIDELFRRADVITVHAPLTSETRGLINDAAIARMKPGVMLINAARGGIIDEAALLRGIESGAVGGAALDVFVEEPLPPGSPLASCDRIICTPHLGASTTEAQERVAVEIGQQVIAYLAEGVVQNAVNLPAVNPEVAQRIQPYLDAARRLGRLVGHLDVEHPSEVRVTCRGLPAELAMRPVAYAALAGFLEPFVEEPINPVRAPVEAQARGIRLVEVAESQGRRFTNAVEVEVRGSQASHRAITALGAGGEPRLVRLDRYELDAVLQGDLLLVQNDDRPGVIGAIGTVLGQHNINVSCMQVGLEAQSSKALALWNVESSIGEATLQQLRVLEHVDTLRLVRIGP